jgi:hypothetical protein
MAWTGQCQGIETKELCGSLLAYFTQVSLKGPLPKEAPKVNLSHPFAFSIDVNPEPEALPPPVSDHDVFLWAAELDRAIENLLSELPRDLAQLIHTAYFDGKFWMFIEIGAELSRSDFGTLRLREGKVVAHPNIGINRLLKNSAIHFRIVLFTEIVRVLVRKHSLQYTHRRGLVLNGKEPPLTRFIEGFFLDLFCSLLSRIPERVLLADLNRIPASTLRESLKPNTRTLAQTLMATLTGHGVPASEIAEYLAWSTREKAANSQSPE